MPHTDYVVRFNAESILYLKQVITGQSPEETTYVWGSSAEGLSFPTLQSAKDMATQIGGGTVGTTRP